MKTVSRDLNPSEVDTVYLRPNDRYVVSLVIGYTNDDVASPEQAVAAAVALNVLDEDAHLTMWHVYDRESDTSRFISTESVWHIAKEMT